MNARISDVKSMLLLEDSEDDVFLFRRALRETSFRGECHACNSVPEATEYLLGCRASFPQLIISDLKLPGDSGLDFVKWLKRDPDLRVIPCLMLSSSWADSDVKAAYSLGVNAYLVKPASIRELGPMLQAFLDFWNYCVQPKLPVHDART